MKKLMIAAAIVCAAAFANAAAMAWGVNYSYSVNGTPYSDRGTTDIYSALVFDALVYSQTDFAKDIAKGVAEVAKNAVNATPALTDEDYGAVGSEDNFTTQKADPGDITSDNIAYAYFVLFDNEDPTKAKNYFITEVADAVAPASGVAGEFVFGEDGDLVASAGSDGWTAVAPEPTSGLLMLLGMGALALRRRRA